MELTKNNALFLHRCPMGESRPLGAECYALSIAKITSLSYTYEKYDQSKVEEAFEQWNCSRLTTDLNCPAGHPPPVFCHRCKVLESSTENWNGPKLTDQQYEALLTRNAAG